MNVFVGDEDAAGLDHVLASFEVGDEAAGFSDQRDACRHVPGREAALPIGVKAAGRDPREVERGSPQPPQRGDSVLHRVVFAAREFHIAPTGMRQRAGNHRVVEPLAGGHPQPLVA